MLVFFWFFFFLCKWRVCVTLKLWIFFCKSNHFIVYQWKSIDKILDDQLSEYYFPDWWRKKEQKCKKNTENLIRKLIKSHLDRGKNTLLNTNIKSSVKCINAMAIWILQWTCTIRGQKKKKNEKNTLYNLPFPFLASWVGPKMFDAMLLRTVRGVDGRLPPKMSLLPPPGGLRTLQNKTRKKLI